MSAASAWNWINDARDPNANDAWNWTSDAEWKATLAKDREVASKDFEETRREEEATLVEHVSAAAPTLPSTAVEHIASSALVANFSLEDAQAYKSEPFRRAVDLRRAASHAVKYVRKQFTTKTGFAMVDGVDLTAEECFVCPPFRQVERVLDIDSDTPDSFKWKEYLVRGLKDSEAMREVLSQPVNRVTIEHTGVKATRRFIIGSDGSWCEGFDAKNWVLRFWRSDMRVVRFNPGLDGKATNYTIEKVLPSVRVSGEGPVQREQRFVGSPAIRQTGTTFLFGGMEDEKFISYLQRRVQNRDGFNIQVHVIPYEPDLPELVKNLRETLYRMLAPDFQAVRTAAVEPTQSALAANEDTQIAPAAGEPTQPAAGEPTQPALAANEGTQDETTAALAAHAANAAIGVTTAPPPAPIGVPPQNRAEVTAWGGWSLQEWDEYDEWRFGQYQGTSFARNYRGQSWSLVNGAWRENNTPARGSQDQSDDRWSGQGWDEWYAPWPRGRR